jgi:hypothetical protein
MPLSACVKREESGASCQMTVVTRGRPDRQGHLALCVAAHIGVGRPHCGTAIRPYVADLAITIVSVDREVLRHLTIRPTRRYPGLDPEVR